MPFDQLDWNRYKYIYIHHQACAFLHIQFVTKRTYFVAKKHFLVLHLSLDQNDHEKEAQMRNNLKLQVVTSLSLHFAFRWKNMYLYQRLKQEVRLQTSIAAFIFYKVKLLHIGLIAV